MWNSCTSVHEFPTLVHIGIAGYIIDLEFVYLSSLHYMHEN